jgi:hypothetical protein
MYDQRFGEVTLLKEKVNVIVILEHLIWGDFKRADLYFIDGVRWIGKKIQQETIAGKSKYY